MSDLVEGSASAVEVRDILSTPVEELRLGVRPRKCIRKLGINTVGELIQRAAEDLLECKNFGMTSLNDVREKLSDLGLNLRGD